MTTSAQIVELVKRMIGVCIRAPGLIPASDSFEEHCVSELSPNFSSYGTHGMNVNGICTALINMTITACNWPFYEDNDESSLP